MLGGGGGFLFGFASDLGNFAGDLGERLGSGAGGEALFSGLLEGALGDALSERFAAVEELLAFVFGGAKELMGTWAKELIFAAGGRQQEPEQGAEGGEADAEGEGILLHGIFELLGAGAVSALQAPAQLAGTGGDFLIGLLGAAAELPGGLLGALTQSGGLLLGGLSQFANALLGLAHGLFGALQKGGLLGGARLLGGEGLRGAGERRGFLLLLGGGGGGGGSLKDYPAQARARQQGRQGVFF